MLGSELIQYVPTTSCVYTSYTHLYISVKGRQAECGIRMFSDIYNTKRTQYKWGEIEEL